MGQVTSYTKTVVIQDILMLYHTLILAMLQQSYESKCLTDVLLTLFHSFVTHQDLIFMEWCNYEIPFHLLIVSFHTCSGVARVAELGGKGLLYGGKAFM